MPSNIPVKCSYCGYGPISASTNCPSCHRLPELIKELGRWVPVLPDASDESFSQLSDGDSVFSQSSSKPHQSENTISNFEDTLSVSFSNKLKISALADDTVQSKEPLSSNPYGFQEAQSKVDAYRFHEDTPWNPSDVIANYARKPVPGENLPFHKDEFTRITRPRRQRRLTGEAYAATASVRQLRACASCRRSHRRCTHVSQDSDRELSEAFQSTEDDGPLTDRTAASNSAVSPERLPEEPERIGVRHSRSGNTITAQEVNRWSLGVSNTPFEEQNREIDDHLSMVTNVPFNRENNEVAPAYTRRTTLGEGPIVSYDGYGSTGRARYGTTSDFQFETTDGPTYGEATRMPHVAQDMGRAVDNQAFYPGSTSLQPSPWFPSEGAQDRFDRNYITATLSPQSQPGIIGSGQVNTSGNYRPSPLSSSPRFDTQPNLWTPDNSSASSSRHNVTTPDSSSQSGNEPHSHQDLLGSALPQPDAGQHNSPRRRGIDLRSQNAHSNLLSSLNLLDHPSSSTQSQRHLPLTHDSGSNGQRSRQPSSGQVHPLSINDPVPLHSSSPSENQIPGWDGTASGFELAPSRAILQEDHLQEQQDPVLEMEDSLWRAANSNWGQEDPSSQGPQP